MPLPSAASSGSLRHELGPTVESLIRVARILERASGELSLSHYRILTMVSAGDGRASRLAGRLALGKPAISAAVDSLASRGLLTRSGSEPDRRATQLKITARGRAVLTAAESAMGDTLADLLGHTSDAPSTLAALHDLAQALSRRQSERESKTPDPLASPGSRR
ncbi:MAG TPA: MarR family winged helix-turn-helix transcriptional regulator [Candidatus Acidoferrales bacterium]|nr:MarR family winged helix-turn-helix transcriptional regulator [Candidatus Acidoferrales bacterium]